MMGVWLVRSHYNRPSKGDASIVFLMTPKEQLEPQLKELAMESNADFLSYEVYEGPALRVDQVLVPDFAGQDDDTIDFMTRKVMSNDSSGWLVEGADPLLKRLCPHTFNLCNQPERNPHWLPEERDLRETIRRDADIRLSNIYVPSEGMVRAPSRWDVLGSDESSC